eukprot:12791989-Heterocapsa_arctica.AAC.1
MAQCRARAINPVLPIGNRAITMGALSGRGQGGQNQGGASPRGSGLNSTPEATVGGAEAGASTQGTSTREVELIHCKVRPARSGVVGSGPNGG